MPNSKIEVSVNERNSGLVIFLPVKGWVSCYAGCSKSQGVLVMSKNPNIQFIRVLYIRSENVIQSDKQQQKGAFFACAKKTL